jgi:hypothetical protein
MKRSILACIEVLKKAEENHDKPVSTIGVKAYPSQHQHREHYENSTVNTKCSALQDSALYFTHSIQ